jgi:hypothetical protein
MQFTVYEDIG